MAPRICIAAAIVASAGVIVPLAYLGLRATGAGLDQLAEMLWAGPRLTYNLRLFGNTLLLAVVVCAIDLALAAPAAWLTGRTRLVGRRMWTVLLVMPLAVPGYLMAFALLSLGGYGSPLEHFGLRLPKVTGFWGATIALSLYLFPYMFLSLRSAVVGLDRHVEEAAQSLGASRARVLWRVVVPRLMPAAAAGGLLVVLHVLADFGVVSLMRFETLSYAVEQQLANADRTYLACLALILVGIALLPIIGRELLIRDAHLQRVGAGAARQIEPAPLGWWALAAYPYLAAIVLAGVILPVGTILYWALPSGGASPTAMESSGVPVPAVAGEFDWDLGRVVPTAPADSSAEEEHSAWNAISGVAANVGPAAWASFRVALPAAILATLLALPIAYYRVRYPSHGSRLAERAVYLGYATPPMAFALSLIFLALAIDQLNFMPPLYKSLGLLVVAYTLHFLAESLGPLRPSMMIASQRLEEAARSLGCRPEAVFRRVTFPLVRSGALVSLAFVFLSCMKELPLTMMLRPDEYETLAFTVWSLTDDIRYAEAAPFALVIVGISTLFVGLLLRTKEVV